MLYPTELRAHRNVKGNSGESKAPSRAGALQNQLAGGALQAANEFDERILVNDPEPRWHLLAFEHFAFFQPLNQSCAGRNRRQNVFLAENPFDFTKPNRRPNVEAEFDSRKGSLRGTHLVIYIPQLSASTFNFLKFI